MKFSKDFFENLLKNYFSNKSLTISSIEETILIPKGNNFLSSIKNIICKGVFNKNESLGKEKFVYELVVKEMLKDSPLDELLQKAFQNERFCYQEILPALNRFANHQIPAPICFYASQDLIVLENLKGFKCLDKSQGFDNETVNLVLKEIANLHAASLIMQRQQPELFSRLVDKLKDFIFDNSTTINPIYATQEESLDLAIKLLQNMDKNSTKINELKNLKSRTFPLQADLIKNSPQGLSVINHGDLWCNNIIFDIDNNRIRLLDFQVMRLASPAADLTYFLYVCTDPELRKEMLTSFLKVYLDELHLILKNKGINLENILTFEWLYKEMKRFALFGFMHGMWLLPLRLNENKDNSFEKYKTNYDVSKLSLEYKTRLMSLVQEYFDFKL